MFMESSILKWRPYFGRLKTKTTEYVQGELHLLNPQSWVLCMYQLLWLIYVVYMKYSFL